MILLNAVVGSIGQKGGYTYTKAPSDSRYFPDVGKRPPAPRRIHAIENPPEWPLANKWQRMRVGQIVYDHLKRKRGAVQVYFSYTLASPSTWPEGRSLAVEVLKDESLIPFHVCSDIVYSETAHYADIILPDATYMERWGFDTRNNFELRDYVTLRQPMVEPPAECESFVDSLIKIGKRISPDVAQYFPFKDHEDWVRQRCAALGSQLKRAPGAASEDGLGDADRGFAYMRMHGVYQNMDEPMHYALYEWPLSAKELQDTVVEPESKIIWKRGADGKDTAVGIMVDGRPLRGFKTPTRKFTVFSQEVLDAGRQVGYAAEDGWPRYERVPSFNMMTDEHLHLTTFKWNVHTQGRTASQKFLSEIVHHNPLWINTATAARHGIHTGDLVELTTFRPLGHTHLANGEVLGKAVVPAFVTEGIHPRVIAMSNSLGQVSQGRAALGKSGARQKLPAWNDKVIAEDQDLSEDVWWDRARGGTGNGYNINAILPIAPSPLVGMQGWFDTVCKIRKVDSA